MRIWTLHPQYLDPQGLVALWRETLLAQAVLRGETRGYTRHPQLERFRQHPEPLDAISGYLRGVHAEALRRGYRFDASRIKPAAADAAPMAASSGQVQHEWQHLMNKLRQRSPDLLAQWQDSAEVLLHPLFVEMPGPVAPWEKG